MNIIKKVIKKISNKSDQGATHIEITGINEEDKAIFCNLYIDDIQFVAGRVYSFDNFPCEELNHGEKELIKGNTPTDKWYIEEIKLWLDSKQFEYSDKALKADLLKLAEPKTKVE